MRRRRPLFRDRAVGTVVGLALLAGGCYVIWEAYEARGDKVPLVLRPFVPF